MPQSFGSFVAREFRLLELSALLEERPALLGKVFVDDFLCFFGIEYLCNSREE